MIPSIYQQRRRVIGGSMVKGASVGLLLGGLTGNPFNFVGAGIVGGLYGGFAGVVSAPRIRRH